MAEVPSVWTVLSMLEWATDFFESKKVKSPRFSIEWLLSHVLSIKRLDLYLEYDRPLSSQELNELRPMVKRRGAHEPLQYITGETDFLHVRIKVRPGVLIPRQETEQMVSKILDTFPDQPNFSVLDVGTGSGCIPIALKNDRPSWKIFATDISEDALHIARENAAYNEVDIQLVQDDLFRPSAFPDEQFDLIISNPPYILETEKELLDDEVKNFEPSLALFCKSTKEMYGSLEKLSSKKLKDSGQLFLELHEHYSEEALQLYQENNWDANLQKDYEGKSRFLVAKKA